MAHPYGSLIDIHGASPIAGPPAVLSKDAISLPDLPTAFELSQLAKANSLPERPTTVDPNRRTQPLRAVQKPQFVPPAPPQAPSVPTTPINPAAIEPSRAASPEPNSVDVVPTLTNPPINKWRVLACCLAAFGNGMNAAAPGALIPYMEAEYRIGYALVSLIFVANALGYISATPIVQACEARFGYIQTLVFSQLCIAAGCIMLLPRPPFPLVVFSFYLLGLGNAFNLALNNTFCANLAANTTILGYFHGGYGLGGTLGPLIATVLVTHARPWSTFYALALATALLGLLAFLLTFSHYPPHNQTSTSTNNPTTLLPSPSSPPARSRRRTTSSLTLALRNRTTILGALFIFAYQGAEVSISGWVTSFLLTYRHPPSPHEVGYVTAGFWGGITLGRFLLSAPCHRFGEKRSVFFLTLGAALFQLLVWFVPNTVTDGVAVAVVGLLLGPIFPCATAVYSKLLPRRLQMSSLAAISALGSSGGAVAPALIGAVGEGVGVWVLHPVCVGLFGMMAGCWGGLGRVERRSV